VFCALHDQLASLDRHAQLTRCFSAVVELLVVTNIVIWIFYAHRFSFLVFAYVKFSV